MNRRCLAVIATLCSFCCVLPTAASRLQAREGEPDGRPLNVVFVLVDDLGWADLACYGSDLHETPHIDRFMREGVRFTEAYAAAPVCTPTRAALMTGKYPARLHMTVWYEASGNPPTRRKLVPPVTVGDLPHEEVTVAEVLHDAGYYTAHVGKWHLGDAAHYPQTQGFDVNIGGTFWGAPQTFFYPYRGAGTFGNEFRYVPHLEFGSQGEYLTDRLTDEAIRVLRYAMDRPVFLYLAFHTVHTPIEAKQEDVDRYAEKIEPGMRHTNAAYAGMVHSLDENVGRLLAELEKLGLADRTVVILTSDNGGYINEYRGRAVTNNDPLRSGKGSLYEGGVRVPLAIRWPGVTPAGAVCREPVITMDFYPTILEMAGVQESAAHNAHIDGLSLVPLLKDPEATLPRDALYWHYPHYYPTTTPVSSIRRGNWKLLEFHEDMRVELYDLESDPGETTNRAGWIPGQVAEIRLGEKTDLAEQMPERAAELRKALHQWRAEVDAQMPEPNPRTFPVSGRLLLDGKPAAGARVMFVPQRGGRPAVGTVDRQGRFELTTFEAGDGAAAGLYHVSIAGNATDEAGADRVIPKRYSRPETSGLTAEVVPGRNELELAITSK